MARLGILLDPTTASTEDVLAEVLSVREALLLLERKTCAAGGLSDEETDSRIQAVELGFAAALGIDLERLAALNGEDDP